MRKTPPVHQFDDYLQFLKHPEVFGEARGRVTYWTRRLGLKSPRSLGMVLSGQRLPSATLLERLCHIQELDSLEKRYLICLVQKAKDSRYGRLSQETELEIMQLKQNLRDDFQRWKVEAVDKNALPDLLGQWYILPLKQLVELANFREDPEWICARFRHKVTAKQVIFALKVLERAKILGRNQQGTLVPYDQAEKKLLGESGQGTLHFFGTGQAEESIAKHHGRMGTRALEALIELSWEKREFSSVTLALNPQDLPAVQAWLQKTLAQFTEQFHCDAGKDVFQLNLQFFPHTGGGSPAVS